MNESLDQLAHCLLICTVGGSHEPIVESIVTSRATRAVFIHSHDSRNTILRILDELRTRSIPLSEGSTGYREVADPQSLSECVAEMRRLTPEVRTWVGRSGGHRVLVDFTAGTKVMTAALALVAQRWQCTFSYVGGAQRDKEGVGIVVTGAEKVLHCENPLTALAYQPVEDAVRLFNHGHIRAAEAVLQPPIQRSDLDPAVKRRVVAVQHFASSYGEWDAFQHGKAVAAFEKTLTASNDLESAFPEHRLDATLRRHRDLCRRLKDAGKKPSIILVLDLLANADRRAADGRFDDAIARLYRAIEALAQFALTSKYQIDTAACPTNRLPPALQIDATGDDPRKLGLQEAYKLLHHLGHPLGQKFLELGLDKTTSPLSMRNHSILAHGFSPLTIDGWKALRTSVGPLVSVFEAESDITLDALKFPVLPNP